MSVREERICRTAVCCTCAVGESSPEHRYSAMAGFVLLALWPVLSMRFSPRYPWLVLLRAGPMFLLRSATYHRTFRATYHLRSALRPAFFAMIDDHLIKSLLPLKKISHVGFSGRVL